MGFGFVAAATEKHTAEKLACWFQKFSLDRKQKMESVPFGRRPEWSFVSRYRLLSLLVLGNLEASVNLACALSLLKGGRTRSSTAWGTKARIPERGGGPRAPKTGVGTGCACSHGCWGLRPRTQARFDVWQDRDHGTRAASLQNLYRKQHLPI